MSRKISSLSILLATMTIGSEALAFSAQGHRWANQAGNPVVFRVHPDGSDDLSDGSDLNAVRRAFQSWDGVACSYLEFAEGTWQAPRAVGNDGVNRIFFVENQAEWTDSPGTLALTYTYWRLSDRVITDSDIRVNGAYWQFTTREAEVGTGSPAKVDLETVMFHEIGHFFGLDHSLDSAAAMFPSANKPLQRTPAIDDVNGLCTLYSNGTTPPAPGGGGGTRGSVGAPCLAHVDCTSSLCIVDGELERTYCSATCGTEQPCPNGYVCEPSDTGSLCLAPVTPDELCDQCEVGNHCASGFCVNVPAVNGGSSFCSRPCDPTPGQPAQCPGGYSCVPLADAAVGGACAPSNAICEPKGKGGQNEACFGNGACKPGLRCVNYRPDAPELGLTFCYVQCPVAYAGQSCTPEGGTQCADIGDNVAVCFNIAREGEPCMPELCDSTSYCAFDRSVDDALCYRLCIGGATCGPNTQCQQYPGQPPFCVPLEGSRRVGQACSADDECATRLCRTYGANRLCTQQCAITDPNGCGPGLRCLAETGSSQGTCWPESFRDPQAGDMSRNITNTAAEFCACDTTHSCDDDCPCDKECASSGCGCTTAGEGGMGVGLLGLALVSILGLRRRR